MGGPHPARMEVAPEERVHTSQSVTALGGQGPSGVGQPLPLSAYFPGDGQHWPHDAPRSNVATQPTPAQALPPGRRASEQTQTHCSAERRVVLQQVQVRLSPKGREVLHQIQVRVSPAKPAGSTTTTTLVNPSPNAQQLIQQQQPNALAANVHSPIIHTHQYVVRHSPASTRAPNPTPVPASGVDHRCNECGCSPDQRIPTEIHF